MVLFTMKTESAGKVLFTKTELAKFGSVVELFPGVEDWFERIRKYGEKKGVIVEHYIISSGLKEMIEGTSIAKNGAFKKISEELGHQIRIESEVGKGTIVRIQFAQVNLVLE